MSNIHQVTFAELYTMDFEIKDIVAIRQKWRDGVVFHMDHPRKSSAIIYLNGCSGEYTSGEKTVIAPCKSLVCLPAFSTYEVLNVDSGLAHPDAYLVEFNVVKDGETLSFGQSPFIISGINTYIAAELACDAVKAYESTLRSPLNLKRAVYNLLAFLSKEQSDSLSKKFDSIRIGIELLEADMLEERSIDEISSICGISSSCFRRLFHEYSGMTPIEYRNGIKLDKAKSMLLESNAAVASIADALGYESSAYFCRFFKKKIGMTPSEYRENNI